MDHLLSRSRLELRARALTGRTRGHSKSSRLQPLKHSWSRDCPPVFRSDRPLRVALPDIGIAEQDHRKKRERSVARERGESTRINRKASKATHFRQCMPRSERRPHGTRTSGFVVTKGTSGSTHLFRVLRAAERQLEGPEMTVVCGTLRPSRTQFGQATKGTRWMPRHQEAMKDAETCDKPRGAGLEL